MILEVRAAPPFYKNGYLVGCERTHEAILIDPGDEVDEILGAVTERELQVLYILLTHAHIDHISGVGRAKEALDVPVYMHEDDLPLYSRAIDQGAMFGFTVQQPPPVDAFYDMTPLFFGDYEVRVHHTPGHSPGGVCLQVGTKGEGGRGQGEHGVHLFVGDTLFAGSIGRTDLPFGDYETLMRSITKVLFRLGDAAVVHPGHGADTTIERERKTNPFVMEYLAARGA
jgi:hydroxyacylglutathione hydrolase